MFIFTLQSSPDLHIIIILGLAYLIYSPTCFLHNYYVFIQKKKENKKTKTKKK